MSTEISSKEANILRACLNEWHDASEFDSASVAYLIHKNRKYLLVEQKTSLSADFKSRNWAEVKTSSLGKRALEQFDNELEKQRNKAARDSTDKRNDKIFQILLAVLSCIVGIIIEHFTDIFSFFAGLFK